MFINIKIRSSIDDGTLKKNNKVVGIWNGSKVLSKKDNTKSKTKSKTRLLHESESESDNMYNRWCYYRGSEGSKGAFCWLRG